MISCLVAILSRLLSLHARVSSDAAVIDIKKLFIDELQEAVASYSGSSRRYSLIRLKSRADVFPVPTPRSANIASHVALASGFVYVTPPHFHPRTSHPGSPGTVQIAQTRPTLILLHRRYATVVNFSDGG